MGDIVSTITPPKKLSTDKFMTSGKYPIIDQSQDYIAGYSDDAAAVVAAKKPVIIFGDHTCAVKYIDFDFIQGADGIKILRPSDNVNSKYLFYFLLSNGIKPSGYKRHFGELKNFKIPIPSLADQSSIVSQIEKEQNIIAANKELITIMQSKIEKVLIRVKS
ncbi:MAG: restriction endonuclease subunit S [Elusimicrobiota bacterium]|nr:restriction endonuclease subunit S [Elusimicrobiota bacterium]